MVMAKQPALITDLRNADLIARTGLSASFVSELLSGKRVPSLAVAERIEEAFGIPATAWMRHAREMSAARGQIDA